MFSKWMVREEDEEGGKAGEGEEREKNLRQHETLS